MRLLHISPQQKCVKCLLNILVDEIVVNTTANKTNAKTKGYLDGLKCSMHEFQWHDAVKEWHMDNLSLTWQMTAMNSGTNDVFNQTAAEPEVLMDLTNKNNSNTIDTLDAISIIR